MQVSLLELNFLPTSGSALTKQQLILARKYRWQVKLTDNIHFKTKLVFGEVIKKISLIKTYFICVCFRRCPWNWSPVEYPQKGHPIIWEIYGSAKMLLLWLQVISSFSFFMCSGIFYSVWSSNITFFTLLLRDELPEAAYMHQLLGLNLLFLLSQNRVSEFHTELERLSARDIQTNVYIRHPVSLEQVLHFNAR